MQQIIRMVIAAIVAIALTHISGVATAQTIKQIKLAEKHVEGFIAAQKDLSPVAEKMQSGASDKPDPQMQAELEEVAKRHGFSNFAELDDVASSISMVMAGIDPQSKEFTEPKVAIQKEIDEVKADTTIAEKQKNQMLDELAEALKSAQPIEHPSNIEIVKMYYDRIDAVMR
jgi:septal ring factor EnvC (AmiA/AmiB activator)